MRGGFTLVEVMVAVTVSALLVLGVWGATQLTIRTAERQKSGARGEEERARAVELLRQEWRGRMKILKPSMEPPAGTRVLLLATTADSLSPSGARGTGLVTWTASEKGLTRKEGDAEVALLSGPASIEFWDGIAWTSGWGNAVTGIRLVLENPPETVVLR